MTIEVPGGANLRPLQVWMSQDDIFGESPRCLGNYLKASGYGVNRPGIRFEGGAIQVPDEVAGQKDVLAYRK
jgi:hypothetical protein